MKFEFLLCERKKSVAEVTLNRPELHNAFNEKFIKEMTYVFKELSKDEEVHLITLKASGKSFCAGADLNWMSSMMKYSKEDNFKDAEVLENLFATINQCEIPVMALVKGHTLGGGVGLISACDYVLCSEEAKLGFTEVRLGLAPATIAPYVINKIGVSQARRWFVSGERFSASVAKEMGLVHEVALKSEIDEIFDKRVESFLKAGPAAARAAKKLVLEFENQNDYKKMTCDLISTLRISTEGQEGMRALLEKRQPNWMNNHE